MASKTPPIDHDPEGEYFVIYENDLDEDPNEEDSQKDSNGYSDEDVNKIATPIAKDDSN